MAVLLRFHPIWLRIVIIVFVLLVVGIAGLFGLTWYALEGFARCNNVVLGSTRSPDETKAVVVFRQECNATVPTSTWASIAVTAQQFAPNRDQAFLGFVGSGEVLSSWKGNDVLEVALIPDGGSFIRHEERANNVRIDYK